MANFYYHLWAFLSLLQISLALYSTKKKNLYSAAFIILLSAVLFGAIGGALAVFIIRDAFAVFYGMQLAQYLLFNSIIVFIIAILVTIIKDITTEQHNSRLYSTKPANRLSIKIF